MNTIRFLVITFCFFAIPCCFAEPGDPDKVDSSTLRGRVMCGYQCWFRCPGDAMNLGWYHWVKSMKEFKPELLTVDLWPDMSWYPKSEAYPVPGFTHPDGSQAFLFSSDSKVVVKRHFELLRDYGIDGVWLQRFVVGLPGVGILPDWLTDPYSESHNRITNYVKESAAETGRVWAVSYDVAGTPTEKVFEFLTENWKKTVDAGLVDDDRYMKHDGKPVVQIWGFYYNNKHNRMTAELANRLIDFFEQPGKYQATLVGGGDWNWRQNPDPEWQAFYKRFKVYCPWNIGHYHRDPQNGNLFAATSYWEEDRKRCEENATLWIPTVYPGFSWDNLHGQEPGKTCVPRRKGMFLWEQFRKLAEMKQTSVYISMLDEFDEGTAILPISNTPPIQGHFVDNEGLPGDWYLRIVGEGGKMIRGRKPISLEIPFQAK